MGLESSPRQNLNHPRERRRVDIRANDHAIFSSNDESRFARMPPPASLPMHIPL